MSKQKQKSESKAEKTPVEAAAVAPRPAHVRRPSVVLIAAFVGLLVAGILLAATRGLRQEVAALKALNGCAATVLPKVEDGLSDTYGLVQFQMHRAEVGEYLSLCEMKPALALKVFREAMDKGNASAKLVAMYSAFYLTQRGQLDGEDLERIAEHLGKDREPDLRKVAQRALSDLTVIDDVAHPTQYEALPVPLPKPGEDAQPHKVQTKEEKLRSTGKQVLLVRWSDADLAEKWWQVWAKQGRWDQGLQRLVIQSATSEPRKGD